MIDTTVTDLLLDDLRQRVRRTADPTGQAVALRAFLESVHKAMGTLLRFDHVNIRINQWFEWMNKAAKTNSSYSKVHPDTYSTLHAIYGQGNISAHENKQALQVTSTICHQRCNDICELFTILVAQMSTLHLDLEAAVLRERETATHLHRAQKLFDAVLGADGTGHFAHDVWPAVEAILGPLDERALNGLRKDPDMKNRIHRAVVIRVSKFAKVDETCPLRQIAHKVAPTAAIEQWLVDDNAHITILRQRPRLLNLFRIEVDATPTSDGGAIRKAMMYDSSGIRTEILADYPMASKSTPEMFRAIIQLFKTGSAEQQKRSGSRPEPREFVLQIAVEKECSMREWESLKPFGPKPTLAEEFLAVAVDPLDEDDSDVDLQEPLDHTRMAFVWEQDPFTIRERYRAQSVFLAGPPAWQVAADDLPPILSAMSQRAAAVLLPEQAQENARAILGMDDRVTYVIWADLIERLGKLKRGVIGRTVPGAYRIFLTDARYNDLDAYYP